MGRSWRKALVEAMASEVDGETVEDEAREAPGDREGSSR
jgi:hypothetical protein